MEGRLAYARQQGWPLRPDQLSRDDGCSGARLDRPALDRLRDAVASGGEVETVLVTSPDRLVAEGSRACRVTVFSKQHVDDLDALGELRDEQGLAPAERETYAIGVRKAAYRDPDGNEFGFGGAPL